MSNDKDTKKARRAAWIFALYMVVVLAGSAVVLPEIAVRAIAAEAAVAMATPKDTLSCHELQLALCDELFNWFVIDVRNAGPEPHKRGPYPDMLREWEAARRNGLKRCTGDTLTHNKLVALLNVRQRLEASSYLLSQTAGSDIALLRD